MILALRALESSGGPARALHATSLSLYVASIASYEVFAVAGCMAGLLYVRTVGFRRARTRWALDIVAIGATLAFVRVALPIDIATPSRTQSLAGMATHAGSIAVHGMRLAGAAALPAAGDAWSWVGAGLLAAVLAAAAALHQRLPRSDTVRAELGQWLAIAGAGALVALTAWAVYVPAPDHYSPTAVGTVNRMNAAAAIGIVILVYSCLVLLARMLVGLVRLPGAAAGLGATAAALALGTAYVRQTAADARAWDAAAADQRQLLADMQVALPRPPAVGGHLRLRYASDRRPEHPCPQHDHRSDERRADVLLEPDPPRRSGSRCDERHVWLTRPPRCRRRRRVRTGLPRRCRRAPRHPSDRPRAVRIAHCEIDECLPLATPSPLNRLTMCSARGIDRRCRFI